MSTGTETVEAALGFLAQRQLPSGAFPVLMGLDLAGGATAVDEAALFGTATIAHSLGFCEAPEARTIRARATAHLCDQMEPGGVWRHWTPDHSQYHRLPADLDDTACISAVLRDSAIRVPDNAGVLLANRDAAGRFHTWLVPHWPPPLHPGYWRVIARRLRRPVEARRFWRTSADPGDVDAVVNANVLHHLGDGPYAGPVVEHLLGVLRRGEEDRGDKWYRSPFVFYYAVSRCARRGVAGLAEARTAICERIAAAQADGGRLGDNALETALAVCALADWDAGHAPRRAACAYLTRSQSAAGSWATAPFYYGGPRTDQRVPSWGSEALTTGLCVEALVRGGQ